MKSATRDNPNKDQTPSYSYVALQEVGWNALVYFVHIWPMQKIKQPLMTLSSEEAGSGN